MIPIVLEVAFLCLLQDKSLQGSLLSDLLLLFVDITHASMGLANVTAEGLGSGELLSAVATGVPLAPGQVLIFEEVLLYFLGLRGNVLINHLNYLRRDWINILEGDTLGFLGDLEDGVVAFVLGLG
jgi:hypothetical protein